jgi:Uma2 family endonuclease
MLTDIPSMNVAIRKPMTLAEFLAWEDRQELRYEFDGLRVIAMAGGTGAHAAIKSNLAVALHPRLRGKPSQFFGSALKFLTGEGTVRYPDAMIVCALVGPKAKFVENPTIVFEVLSPSTTDTDRIVKAREYEATPSVRRYVMLEQDSAAAVVYARVGESWTHDILLADSSLAQPEIELDFPLTELYDGVEFETPADDGKTGGD